MNPFEHHTGRLSTDDGFDLFYQSWIPPEPQCVLLFVHGLGEHSGRYDNPVRYFTARRTACWSIDLRGHGHSPGRRVHVDHFDDYARDVLTLHKAARKQHPDLPIILVGHSMGGLIALRYLLSPAPDLKGAIVSSPGLAAHPKLEPPALLKFLARILSHLAPRLLLSSNLDAGAISRDSAVVEAYREDPLVSDRVSTRWYTATVEAQAEVFARAPSLQLPLLLMQSGSDFLISPEATGRWAAAAPQELVQYRVWEDFYHEMFNEPERGKVFALMKDWLDNLGP